MHPSDFDTLLTTHNGFSRTVYRKGTGPIVVILPEIPGLHRSTFELARKIADHDFSVYLLSLFGEDNEPFRYRDAIKKIGHVCINREFAVLASRRSSPIIDWVRSFCCTLQSQSNSGIGLIGMCITGNFALGLLAEPWMLAPVLSQPSLPLGRPSGLHVDPQTLQKAKEKTELEILGLRFSNDIMCPKQRFERLHSEFSDRFHAIDIDSSIGNSHHIPLYAHSVLTKDFVDKEGHPTHEALQKTIAFLQMRLKGHIL